MYPEFCHSLEKRDWKVDTNLDHYRLHDVLPPSKPPATGTSETDPELNEAGDGETNGALAANRQAPFSDSPRRLWELKRVLITKTSHIGGHKFAGNVIVSQWLLETSPPPFISLGCIARFSPLPPGSIVLQSEENTIPPLASQRNLTLGEVATPIQNPASGIRRHGSDLPLSILPLPLPLLVPRPTSKPNVTSV